MRCRVRGERPAGCEVSSLLDHDEDRWREMTASKTSNSHQSFLTHARTVVEVLRDGAGWDVEYRRDIWRLQHPPGPDPELREDRGRSQSSAFRRITQP